MIKHIQSLKVSVSITPGSYEKAIEAIKWLTGNYFELFSVTEWCGSIDITIVRLVWTYADTKNLEMKLGDDLINIIITPNAKID